MAMLMSSQVYRPSQVAGTKNSTLLKTGTQPNRFDRIEFNLSTDDYLDLLKHIRSIVQNPGWYSHNLPVLSGRTGVAPPDWLDIVLSTNTGQNITLRIRQDDLYLVGYQMQSSSSQCGQWLEFGIQGSSTQLIPGSTFLGFEGSYTALENAGGRLIQGMTVSRQQVIAAVNELASTTNPSNRARDLALMIMVICEATRFEEISRRFASVMQSGSTGIVTIEDWMLTLFRAWGDLSGRLINADAYGGDPSFRLPTDSPLRQRIQSALDAVSYLALLLGPLKINPPRSGLGASAKSGAGAIDVPRGQPMMDVLSIQIYNYSGGASNLSNYIVDIFSPNFQIWEMILNNGYGSLSGTITVTDGLGPQTLFSGSQYVQSGGTLTLGLLSRAISAWESILFNCNFTTPCCSGSDLWNIFQTKDDYTDNNNNGIRSLRLARHGTTSKRKDATDLQVWVYYGLFREAWQIRWEVKIVNGDGYNPMNVYGSVNVSYSIGGYNFNVNLFSRSSDDNVTVYVGGCVKPLLRNAMALPLDVNVNVDVNLWDYIRVLPDRCIAQGRASTTFGSQDAAKAKNAGSYILKLASNGNYAVEITAYYSRMSAD